MDITIAISTKNNPQALSSCIASILARKEGHSYRLMLADASDTPVTVHPHISRMLTLFDTVVYKHFCGINTKLYDQRMWALQASKSYGLFVIQVDDDVVLITDLASGFRACVNSQWVGAFGQKVDILNDRGYKDFSTSVRLPGPNDTFHNHEFTIGPFAERKVIIEEQIRHADNGLVIVKASPMIAAINSVLDSEPDFDALPPSIVDDAAIQLLARDGNMGVTRSLQGYHIGNNNNNWLSDSKVDTVSRITKRIIKERKSRPLPGSHPVQPSQPEKRGKRRGA